MTLVEERAFSVVWDARLERAAREHLLQHHISGVRQEDILLATWYPAFGETRDTAVLEELHLPSSNERVLQGNVQLRPAYIRRVRDVARKRGAGIAVMHNHFTPGWQDMSPDDVGMERDSLLGPGKATGHPVVGLTLGTDGTWSARRWIRAGGSAHRQWARTVRTVGNGRFRMTFLPSADDGERCADVRPTHRRTIQGLGDLGFRRFRQLSVAVVGVGSVGSIVAEALARMKVRELLLVDFDKVEEHNLDRLLHATRWDIGRFKVDVTGSRIDHNFSSGSLKVLRADIRDEPVFRSIADYDIVLACVDKPIARDLLNHLAIAHVVPVIEGGVFLEAKQGALARGQVTARVIYPGAECLRCAGQYSLDGVSLEVQGLLEDPEYLRTAAGSDLSVGANTFAASLLTAAEQLDLLVRFIAGADWWPVVNEIRHDLKFGRALPHVGSCSQTCDMVDKQRKGSPAEPTWLLRGRTS